LSWASEVASLTFRTLRGLGISFFKGIDWIIDRLLMD